MSLLIHDWAEVINPHFNTDKQAETMPCTGAEDENPKPRLFNGLSRVDDFWPNRPKDNTCILLTKIGRLLAKA